jgi:RNA polymerase sigma-70 factor (ECF subfamily)
MDAFEQLVTANMPAVYRLARAYAGDAGAEDLAQESFLAAWRALPTLREPDRFGPWLHRIALNRSRSSVRGSGRVREIAMDPTFVEPAASGDFRTAVEARAVVRPAFARLSDDARAVIALHYAAGLSIRECGEVLGIPEGTVKSRLNAALTSLRAEIGRVEP